jgi:hypothetical protein
MRAALIAGMTTDKKSFLLSQLQGAVDQAISESHRIGEIVDEMKRCGFDVCLKLETTVSISPAEEPQPEAVPQPRWVSNASPDALASQGSRASMWGVELTNEDLEFLQYMKIAA